MNQIQVLRFQIPIFLILMFSVVSLCHGERDWREGWFRAVEERDVAALSKFIEHDVDLDAKDRGGETALMLSCSASNTNIVNILVENKVDLEAKGKFEETALMRAASAGSLTIISNLLSNGAQVNAKDLRWLTPLAYAMRSNNTAACELLLMGGANPNVKPLNKPPLLVSAIQANKKYESMLLLKYGADVNQIDSRDATTALMVAASVGDVELLDSILANGANINAADHKGFSALMHAVVAGRSDAIAFLLQNGADVNCRGKRKGLTPLMIAAELGNVSVVNLLIRSGADLNAKDNIYGSTALMLAKAKQRSKVIAVLLDSGAEESYFSNKPTSDDAKQTLAELRLLKAAYDQWRLQNNRSDNSMVPSFDMLLEYVPSEIPLYSREGRDLLGNYFLLEPEPTLSQESVVTFQSVTGDDLATRKFWGKFHP